MYSIYIIFYNLGNDNLLQRNGFFYINLDECID